MERLPAAALRQAARDTRLLAGYALVGVAALAVVGAMTPDDRTFKQAAWAMVLAGWVLLVAVGAERRRTRRALVVHRPALAQALAGRGDRLPGSGWAGFVYLPLLLAGVSLATVVHVATHPPSGLLIPVGLTVGFALAAARWAWWYDRNVRAPYLALLEQTAQAETAGVVA